MAGVAGAGAAGVVSMDTAKRMDEDIAGDVATGAAGVAGAGMDDARRTDEDIADVAGAGMDTAERADEGIADVAGAGMDTAERMGEDVAGDVVTGALIGNVDPLNYLRRWPSTSTPWSISRGLVHAMPINSR